VLRFAQKVFIISSEMNKKEEQIAQNRAIIV